MCQTSSSFQKKSLASELWLFLELAVPTTLLNLGYIISPLLTASYVGRKFGSIFFSGLMHGLFSATDTLGTQAFGSGNKKKLG
jgi:hypothetical protein